MTRLLAVFAVAGLATAAFTFSTATGDHTKREKLHRVTTFVKLGDLKLSDADGSGGPSDGDIQTFSITAFDREGGTQIGSGTGNCVLLKAPLAMCTSSVTDDNGTLVITGQDNQSQPKAGFAVVGGNGDYEKVRGSVRLTQKEGDPSAYTARARLFY